MIKINNEKQEEILREMIDLTKDISSNSVNTRDEVAFFKDQLSSFNSICNDFKKNLTYFIKNFSDRFNNTINQQFKLVHEKKRNYKNLIRFAFTKFKNYFESIEEKFDKLIDRPQNSFIESLSLLQNQLLPDLIASNNLFKDELSKTDTFRGKLRHRKDEYFDLVHELKLEKLYQYRNLKCSGDKVFAKVQQKEQEYFRSYVIVNQEFAVLVRSFKLLVANYESFLKKKLILYIFGMFNESPDTEPEYKNLEDTALNFKISFIDVRTEIYLNNTDRIYETYFSLPKIIEYRSKLEQESIRLLVSEITKTQTVVKEKADIEILQLLVNVVALDLNLQKDCNLIKEKLVQSSSKNLKVLLQKLKLFMKYEGSFLFISKYAFELFQTSINMYYNNISENLFESEEVAEVSKLLFYVGTRIFLKPENKGTPIKIEYSLLNASNRLLIFMSGNFWRSYFHLLTSRLEKRESSPKLRAMIASEKMLFVHYFLMGNMEMTVKLIESVIDGININFKLISKNGQLKISIRLYQATIKNTLKTISYQSRMEKIQIVFCLLIQKEFLTKVSFGKVSCLNSSLRLPISFSYFKIPIFKTVVNDEKRKKIWVGICKLGGTKPPGPNFVKQILSQTQLEQIHIDVIRTKQARGESYQKILEETLIEFLEYSPVYREYFQGFNYITSFLLDYLGDRKKALVVMEYIATGMIAEFFTDALCVKLNLIHFQLNHLIAAHFPNLWVKWRNYEFGSEVLFSTFLISLFSSFGFDSASFVVEFWDLILVEGWRGVCKCVLFIVQTYLSTLMKCDMNETLKFFSELKNEEKPSKQLKETNFKFFAENFKFDDKLFEELELKYKALGESK